MLLKHHNFVCWTTFCEAYRNFQRRFWFERQRSFGDLICFWTFQSNFVKVGAQSNLQLSDALTGLTMSHEGRTSICLCWEIQTTLLDPVITL